MLYFSHHVTLTPPINPSPVLVVFPTTPLAMVQAIICHGGTIKQAFIS